MTYLLVLTDNSTHIDIKAVVSDTLTMENINLPNTLKIVLQQLLTNNTVKSWNVFEDRKGDICCNIKLDIYETDQTPKRDMFCAYRKISPKQQDRNKSRLSDYNIAKKRQTNDDTPEITRTYSGLDTCMSHIDTPISVVQVPNADISLPLKTAEPDKDELHNASITTTIIAEAVDLSQEYEPMTIVQQDPQVTASHYDIYQEYDYVDTHLKCDSSDEGDTQDTQVSLSPTTLSKNGFPSFDLPQIPCRCCGKEMTLDHICENELDGIDSTTPLDSVKIATPCPDPPDAVAVQKAAWQSMEKEFQNCKTQ